MIGESGLGIRSRGPPVVSVLGQYLALGPPSNIVHNTAVQGTFSGDVDAMFSYLPTAMGFTS